MKSYTLPTILLFSFLLFHTFTQAQNNNKVIISEENPPKKINPLIRDSFYYNTPGWYKQSLGLKIPTFYGLGVGITYKNFIQKNGAIEAQGIFWQTAFLIAGFYEFHFPIPSYPEFKLFLGPGAHIGTFYTRRANYNGNIGADIVLGLDYKFKKIPLNLSLDWQPSFNIAATSGANVFTPFGGLSVRYSF